MKDIKKTISIVLAIIFIMVSFQLIAFAKSGEDADKIDPRTFWIGTPEDQDISDSISEDEDKSFSQNGTKASLPSSVDLSSQFPTPGDQQSYNSCTAWAVGYALQSQAEKKKRNWTVNQDNHTFSPTFIYRNINLGLNIPTRLDFGLTVLKNKGCCPVTYLSNSLPITNAEINDLHRSAAALYKITNYYRVGDYSTSLSSAITNMKQKLNQGFGIVTSIKTYSDFNNISASNPVYDTIGSGGSYGLHNICLVGYNDSMGSNGAFKFINSWGTSWGLSGYGWIDYNLLPQITNLSYNLQKYVGGFYVVKSSADSYMMGDVDGDGEITVTDSRLALRQAVGLEELTTDQFVLADVNGDGSVEVEDAQEILAVSVGSQTTFSLYT